MNQAAVQEVAALLLELHAWRQDVPEGTFLPDTSFAHVRIFVGTESTDVWELHGQPDRLVRIKRMLEALVPGLAQRKP